LSADLSTPSPGGAARSALGVASFLAFGSLLVLYGANSSQLITSLSLDYADLGLLGSMLSLGLGIGIVLAGPIIDRFPRKPLYVGACLAVIAAATTLDASTSYQRLLIHTIAIGFGAGFYETVLNALIVEEYGSSAPRRLLFIHAAATAAASATPLLLAFARGYVEITWFEAFRYAGLGHLLLVAGAFFVHMKDAPRLAATSSESSPDDEPKRFDDRLALAAVCLVTFAYVGVESAISLFVVDHTTSELGLSAERAARTISAFWGGLLVGRLAVGLSPRPVGAGTTAALASVSAVLMLFFGLGWIGIPELAMTAVGFFLGGVFPIMIGLAGIAMPTAAGTAVGLAGGLGSLGGFIIPWLTGRLANDESLAVALTSLSLWLMVLVIAAAIVRKRLATRPTDPGGTPVTG